MKDMLKALFTNKKALVSMASLLVAGGAKLGLDLDDELVFGFLGVVAAALVGNAVVAKQKEK